VSYLQRAAQEPDAPLEALRLLGVALVESGQGDAALSVLQRAAAVPGAGPGALVELGIVYLGLARRADARGCFERALVLDPEHAAAHASLALVLLGSGEFRRGWNEYEWRLRTPFDEAPRGAMPYASCGADVVSKAGVFVASEQGIGDEIMFASCVPDLVAAAGGCVLECSSRLVPLFARSFPRARVIARSRAAWPLQEKTGPIGCGLWAGSLPRLYRATRESFPGLPFLLPDAGALARRRAELGALGAKFRVGLAWTGGLPETARAQRSLPLAALRPLFELPDIAFVSLELMDRRAEAREVSARGGARLHHWPGLAADPDQLAALVAALDLVVCVPNAAAHMAGALGSEVWVLVPGAPTWRYMWEGERVPWYRSMRVLRRSEGDSVADWMREVRDALALRFGL
jgi:tetratricopeptide (TPR) repeat protein